MILGDRIRQLRESKKQTQGDIQARTGLLRCYISRVENGYTVPTIDTLEKFANALEVPLYQLFYEGTDVPAAARAREEAPDDNEWAGSCKDVAYFRKLTKCLGAMSPTDRTALVFMCKAMCQRNRTVERS
jgi:transcriptional regulator with XRE-family HTH domain